MRSHNKSNAHDRLKSKYIVNLPLLSTPFTKLPYIYITILWTLDNRLYSCLFSSPKPLQNRSKPQHVVG